MPRASFPRCAGPLVLVILEADKKIPAFLQEAGKSLNKVQNFFIQ